MSTLKSSAEDLTLNADGSGNDVIIQSDGSTVVTVDGTNSRVGIGVASPSAKIDIADSSIAALLGSSSGTTRADATAKIARVGVVHYTNAQEPVGFLYGQSTDAKNQIAIGGGSSLFNAATEINFWTAANQTTTTGTNRMNIDSAGDVTVNTGNVVMGTAGKGIDFSANSNNAGMSSELFDSYEEGLFQAEVNFTVGGSMTVGNSETYLAYTKIGRVVHVQGVITLTAESSPDGSMMVTLPFTVGALTEKAGQTVGVCIWEDPGQTIENGGVLELREGNGYGYCVWYSDTGVDTTIGDSTLDSNFNKRLHISVTYITT